MKIKLSLFMALILLTLAACSNNSLSSSMSTPSQAELSTPPSSSSNAPSSSVSSNAPSSEPFSSISSSIPPSEPSGSTSSSIPSSEPPPSSSEQSEVAQQQSSASLNEGVNPEWNGYYERIIYESQEYASLGWTYERSDLGESLGEVMAYGLDFFKSILHRTTFEAFEIKDVSPEEGVAVKLDIEGEILYVPYFAQEQSMYAYDGVSDFTEQWH